MSHSAINIAQYLVNKSHNEDGGEPLTNLKVQKLLYYCQSFYYAKHSKSLFNEKIVAWQYGPVVKEVYHHYKEYSSDFIDSKELPNTFKLESLQQKMINEVYDFFNQFSAIKLMHMTHNESPWLNTELSDEIKLSELKSYFTKYLK